MKTKLKRSLSLFMSAVLFMAILPFVPMNVKAAKAPTISYAFENRQAGFAQGVITLSADASDNGTYWLYWADDSTALNGYYEISKVEVSGGKGSYEFLANIAIPADAVKIIAFKSDEEPTDKSVMNADIVYDIPAEKVNPHKSSEKTLSFEALSDTQLDLQSSVFYTFALEHFAAALENAAAREVDFVTVSGDCINNYQNGTSKEWQVFQKIIAASSYSNPIYEANGNHSMKSDIGYGLPAFETATGLGADNSELGDDPWYEITAPNGDHFIFLALETSSDVAGYDEFSTEQLDWLESRLKEYYNDDHHIFIFEHAFFHGWGPGDDKTAHYYSGGLRTTSAFPGNERFRRLMDTYTEVFLYTGHSHLDFEYNWNYDNEGGQTANLFHIPATACTTHVTDGKLDYYMDENNSQCYIVDVYDDMVISNGLSVVDNLIYPAYTYIVTTKDYTHEPIEIPTEEEESTEESSEMIDVQIENATSYLYSDGAALFFYNNDSGNVFPVDSKTGIARIPANARNLTLYRCKGSWNSGAENKSDSVTSYYNKYGPLKRNMGQTIFYVAGSSDFSWKEGTVSYPEEKPTDNTPAEEESATKIDVQIENATSYLYSDGAALFFYNNDSGNVFPVDSKTGIAQIPENAKNLTLYRCKGSWNSGEENKSDDVTSYFNKYGPTEREAGQIIFYVAGSSNFRWKEGAISYPEENPTEEETTESDEGKETYTETTVYWAIPKDYANSGYTYKMNIRCVDGKYPHSARTMSDTGKTYNGLKVYSYTFSAEYTEEYDTKGINRIQMQGISGSTTLFQYAVEDKQYTISELDGKVFIVAGDDAPDSTKLTATKDNFEAFTADEGEASSEQESSKEETTPSEQQTSAEEETTKTYTETTVYWAIPKDYADSGYTYKMNIRCVDGKYPHSARTMSDTGKTYNGLKVYSYTFSAEYTEEYDTKGINRIQMQGISGSTTLFQYALEDKQYTISELNGKVFIAAGDDAPDSTKLTASESNFEVFSEDYLAPASELAVLARAEVYAADGGEDTIDILVKDTTSTSYVYSSGAAVYLYDVDTGEHYRVTDETATVPKTAVNLTVYRCQAEWGGGNKTDDVTSYWNKWELVTREEGNDAINLSGDGASVWTSSREFEEDGNTKYYLLGYFDGADYEGREYEFDENGELEIQFYDDSYVYLLSSASTSYWTNGWLGENIVSATFYKVTSLSDPEKLFVSSGKIKFKLTVNNDGTLTLSYESLPLEFDKSEITVIDDEAALQTTADVSTLEKLTDVTKSLLRTDYRYSSYVDYARLKRTYYNYRDLEAELLSESEINSIYNEFLGVYNNYLSMKEKNNVVTVYFCNDIGWAKVNAYIYNSETGKGINTLEKAQGISQIKVLESGVKIYCVTVNRSKWDKIIFTSGDGQQTAALDIPEMNYVGFYFSDSDLEEAELVPNKFLYTFDSLDTYEELVYSMHDITVDSALKATAASDGKSEGSHCAKCGMIIEAQKTIPAIQTVSLSQETFVYDGADKKPSVTVTDRIGRILAEGVDYTVTFPEASSEVGQYTVTVDFIGNYEGQILKNYIVTAESVPTGDSASDIKYMLILAVISAIALIAAKKKEESGTSESD
ncbi:MAG: starch-binding protein [Butyrivibrio sp.]|nr:starch-binding protein [Butyrivibrio sp.]